MADFATSAADFQLNKTTTTAVQGLFGGLLGGAFIKPGDRTAPKQRVMQQKQTTAGLKSAAVGSRGVTTTPAHKTATGAGLTDAARFDGFRKVY